jgi:2-succinyl-5-enolpyruvyl-6-hydroxy-3-cyclohexene-1-carboxylate synthase
MKTSSKISVQLILEHCLINNIQQVVISPGSRNAPLIIAFNQHPDIECLVVPDERSAAFVALGISLETKKPVAIICTSGSAPLNYYPAIAEAYYQNIPLVAITADRPEEWINQGDGQTIVQKNVFQNHISYFVQVNDFKENGEKLWAINRELSIAFSHTNGNKKGPVHINMAFAEPLYETIEIEKLGSVQSIQFNQTKSIISQNLSLQLEEKWRKFPKKLILCGQLPKDDLLNELLVELSKDSSVLILVENTSNLVHQNFIHCIDRLLNSISENEVSSFIPDLLITIGGAVVSKRIKSLFRNHPPKEHWKIGNDFPKMDTYQCLSASFEIDEIEFFKTILSFVKGLNISKYALNFKQKDYLIQEKQVNFFKENKMLSDISTFHVLLDSVPEMSNLHLANSSVIRYSQLFDPIKSIHYFCNRGTSGIDGSTSTALGTSFANPNKLNVLITGDMSFFYDSNAFWNHLNVGNLRIFFINNGGGSIFKIIPGPDKTEELDEFFVFNNNFSAKKMCELFDINYYYADSLMSIENQLTEFYISQKSTKISLMEINTSNTTNEKELKDYFEKIKV